MAMSNDSYDKQLQELVTCTICSDYYRDPRRLSCSHTFCFQCIEKSIENGSFNCPLQDDVTVDQNDINQLPINQAVNDMVEHLSNMNLSTGKKLSYQCNECSENQAVNWCERCACHFCESCTKSIHSKALQFHTITSLLEKLYSFCMDHPDLKFTYWCIPCKVLVCRDCLYLFQHKDHPCLSLKDATTKAKTKFQKTLEELDVIKQNLTTFSDTTKNAIKQQQEIGQQQKQDIEQMFAYIQQRLEQRKRIIIKQLEDNELQTMNIFDQQRNTIDKHLNLTIIQELCLKNMLNSNDPLQILKFKSTLYHNYNDFMEHFNRIDDGYQIQTHLFKKDGRDIEQILGIISRLGYIISTSYTIKGESITIKTSTLDISRAVGNIGSISRESNYARGYKFLLKKSFKLRSIQIHSDHLGPITSFVVNDTGIIIQKETINSTDSTMKWLTIPIECDVQNNYSVLVSTPSDNGSYTYKNGDNQVRVINQNCSVESKYVHSVMQINVGSKMLVENNNFSIDMMLGIEE